MRTRLINKKTVSYEYMDEPAEYDEYEYLCPCRKGKIVETHDDTPGNREHLVWFLCKECEKKYRLDKSKVGKLEVYEKRLPKAMYNSEALFNPYQYEPLMKLFDSKTHKYNGKNILITDEVGVGKTIEAGIIIKEYLQIYPNARIIIICPAKLCENWEKEMKNLFYLNFKNFRKDKDIEGWPCILPNSFFIRTVDVSKEEDEEVEKEDEEVEKEYCDKIKGKIEKYGLQSYDLLIVDEAHSVRNRGKLFNGIKALIDNKKDELRIFMTATPVVNKKEDYGAIQDLLKLNTDMEPENTRTMQGQANCYDYQLEITMKEFEFSDEEKEIIEYVYVNQFAEHNRGYMKRAMASSINTLREYYNTTEGTARDNVVKEEIKDAKGQKVDDDEKEVRVDSGDYYDLSDENDENTIKAYCDNIKMISKENNQNNEPNFKDRQEDQLKKMLEKLSDNKIDSKLVALMKLVDKIKSDENENKPFKVVIFTWSKKTAEYLKDKLKDSEYIKKISNIEGTNTVFCFSKTAVINGDTPNAEELLKCFEKEDRPMALICTEAAREGLNMQFCHNLIHYDFPFSPASLCQRNGRIYRPRKDYDLINPRVWYMYSGYGYDRRQYDEIILSKLELIKELADNELIVPMNILPKDKAKLEKALFRNFVDQFVKVGKSNDGEIQIQMKDINKLIKFLYPENDDLTISESKIFNSEEDFKCLNELIQAYLKKGVDIERKKREEESSENYKEQYCAQLKRFYEYIGGENASEDTQNCNIDKTREELFKKFSKYCDEIFANYSTKLELKETERTIEDIWYSWQIYSTEGGRKLVRLSDDQLKEVTLEEFSQHHVMWKQKGEKRNE